MLDVGIRIATISDLETMVAFNIALAKETEAKDLEPKVVRRGVQVALEQEGLARYFIAESDSRAIGQTMLTSEWSDWRAGAFWWIQSVYVEPNFRGQGVFASIYRHIETLANNDDNCCGLRLYVELENRGAMRTYEKLGMRPARYQFYEAFWK